MTPVGSPTPGAAPARPRVPRLDLAALPPPARAGAPPSAPARAGGRSFIDMELGRNRAAALRARAAGAAAAGAPTSAPGRAAAASAAAASSHSDRWVLPALSFDWGPIDASTVVARPRLPRAFWLDEEDFVAYIRSQWKEEESLRASQAIWRGIEQRCAPGRVPCLRACLCVDAFDAGWFQSCLPCLCCERP